MKNPDKTEIYSNNSKTTTYGDSKQGTKETVHKLNVGDDITLNKKDYKILEIISESTGEAVIYKIQDNKNKLYGLKLYFEFTDSEHEPNPEALARIKEIKDVDILRLYDYGTGVNKYQGKYCFEISDFALGYDLLSVKDLKTKYTPEFLEKEVVPQIFLGILKLHENRIYHCDLKPRNIFYLDKEQIEIVIGDYGSAKTFEFDAEKQSRKTTTVKGSDFYLPPEQARGFISKKNDYYSFGMILLHLFYPEKILTDINKPKNVSHSKFKQIIERQFEAKPIIDFNPEYERINNLIEGLTLVDFNLRWGKEQIEKWIKGERLDVIYKKSGISTQSQYNDALIFSGHTINAVEDLRDYILSSSDWYVDLIEDEDNKKDFTDWIIKLYDGDKSKRSAFNRIIKDYSQEGIDIVGDAVIRFFIHEHPVFFGLKEFDFYKTKDLQRTVAEAFSHLIFKIWNSSSQKDIRLYIFRFEFALRQREKGKREVNKILKLFYRNNRVKRITKADKQRNKVLAYASISKTSIHTIKQFLLEYLPSERSLSFEGLNFKNELEYKLNKLLKKYFSEIGIVKSIEEVSVKKKVTLKYPADYNSFDDFCKKTIDSSLNIICSQNSVSKDVILEESYRKFIDDFKVSFKDLFDRLKKEFNNLDEVYSERLKYDSKFKKDLNGIEDIFKKERFHEINLIITQLPKLKKRAKQLWRERQKFIEANKLTEKEKRKRLRVKIRRVIFWIIVFSIIGSFFKRGLDEQEDYSYKNAEIFDIKMIFIKGGTFNIGDELGSNNETLVHDITLSDYYISKFEITAEQYCNFLIEFNSYRVKKGKYKSKKMLLYGKKDDFKWNVGYKRFVVKNGKTWEPLEGYENFPIRNVTWYGANEYCNFMGFRLPTEAEWEYAAKNREKEYELNIRGLTEGVKEWCEDWYSNKYFDKSPDLNPVNKKWSKWRSVRGTGSDYQRDYKLPHKAYSDLGFRVCLTKL